MIYKDWQVYEESSNAKIVSGPEMSDLLERAKSYYPSTISRPRRTQHE